MHYVPKGRKTSEGRRLNLYAGGGDVEDKALVELGNLLPRDVRINVRSTRLNYAIMLHASCMLGSGGVIVTTRRHRDDAYTNRQRVHCQTTRLTNRSTPKQHPSTRTTV